MSLTPTQIRKTEYEKDVSKESNESNPSPGQTSSGIPIELKEMFYLFILNLGHNNLARTIAEALGSFKNVAILDLSDSPGQIRHRMRLLPSVVQEEWTVEVFDLELISHCSALNHLKAKHH
ncbi:hypothetical protein L1887_05648 [Cichorium endivia]|nr:hypothetical protein L1887_05648 [Cichorium endivia]